MNVVKVALSSLLLVLLLGSHVSLSWNPWVSRAFSPKECNMCRFAVGLVNYAIQTSKGSEQVYRVANTVCSVGRIEPPLVCSSVSRVFNRELIKVLANGVVTPNQVCGLLSNNTCGHFNDPLANWEVNLNVSHELNQDELARRQEILSRNQPQTAYKVLHMSDTHVDLKYQEGSPAKCEEPLCCRSDSTPPPSSRILNTPNSTIDKAGHWGAYSNCDVPLRTFESMLKAISTTINNSNIDYIIWTGDIQPHDVWEQDKRSALNTYEQVFAKIFAYLPNVKIFPTFGNHEMVPVDSYSPSNLLSIAREDSPEWVYRKFDSYWSQWLPEQTAKTITKDGFYAAPVKPGLKVISLNTNFCHSSNLWLYINSTDPGNQLQWLVHELLISELEHEKVHIIGHIPPGVDDCFKVWSKNYNKILRRFSKTVTGQFFGHTHQNEFQMFYNRDGSEMQPVPINSFKDNLSSLFKRQVALEPPTQQLPTLVESNVREPEWKPISVGFVGSSLTTFIDLNPSFRIYDIDPSQGFLPTNFVTYYMNLTEANSVRDKEEPKWVPSESFAQLFGLNDTSPTSMHNLLLEMVIEMREEEEQSNNLLSEGEDLFMKFYSFASTHYSMIDATEKTVDTSTKLYRLWRLFNTYSDKLRSSDYKKLNKRKFLCRFFTGQSNTNSACDKFIQDALAISADQQLPL